MNLEELRQKINQIDDELIKLLEKRMDLVSKVASYKLETGKAVFDSKREETILNKVAEAVESPVYKDVIVNTFTDMMKHSRAFQERHIRQTR